MIYQPIKTEQEEVHETALGEIECGPGAGWQEKNTPQRHFTADYAIRLSKCVACFNTPPAPLHKHHCGDCSGLWE